MTDLTKGDIIPGEGVGIFRLDWSLSRLMEHLPEHYETEKIPYGFVIWTPIMGFWIDADTLRITQILVRGAFRGKLKGIVGIGSTLLDVEAVVGQVDDDEDDGFGIQDMPGICFEVHNTDGYSSKEDVMTEPITEVSVYESRKGDT